MNRTLFALSIVVFITTSGARADYAPWNWSQPLPQQFATKAKRSNRTPEAVDRLFHQGSRRPSIPQILEFLGQPDAFSPQSMYSKAQGSATPSKTGGTLRFLLDDAGELHVWTSDDRNVGLAIRYRAKGGSELLFK
jgi:hypothetical protein